MQQIKQLWQPVLGRVAWNVGRGHGSALRMEFGLPHLSIREPIASREGNAETVRRGLQRRAVHILGDWSFWVLYGNWKLRTTNGEIDSETSPGTPGDECLRDLEGQRLLSIDAELLPHSWVWKFDLGAVLEVSASTDIIEDQWTLRRWNADIAACQADGSLVLEKVEPLPDGVS